MQARPAVRTTASFVGGLVVAFGVLQVIQQVASAFDPRPVITALLSVGVAALGALLAHRQSATTATRCQAHLRRLLAVNPDERPAFVDAIALGVFPAVRRRGRPPPYVPREIDKELQKALAAGTSVVVTGPPLAGKTRSALQAARDATPDAAIIAPRGPEELKELLVADPQLQVTQRRRILWLDDLPQYAESLDQPAIDRLPLYFPSPKSARTDRGGKDQLTVVATVRDDEWTAMLASTGAAGQLARGLADRASVHQLPQTDPVFESHATSIYPDVVFVQGPGQALATSGTEKEPPEAPGAPHDLSEPVWWDPTAVVLAGTVAASVVLIGFVLLVSGFSTRTPPPIPVQIAAIERRAANDGEYVRSLVNGPLDLHGTGQESRLFLFTRTRLRQADPAPSDEIRIYDDQEGWLRQTFRFRPAGAGVQFRFRGARDIDADGATEVVGAFASPDGRYAMLPFAIDWQAIDGRYAVVPLDLGPPVLSRTRMPNRFRVQARLYRKLYTDAVTIRDATSRQEVRGHRVQEFVITAPPRIVAAYFLRPPFDLAKDAALYEIHAAILAAGRTPTLTPCALAGIAPPRMKILLSERSQERALVEQWARATANRYCAVVSDH